MTEIKAGLLSANQTDETELPTTKSPGRPRLYANDEERRAAKQARDRARRAGDVASKPEAPKSADEKPKRRNPTMTAKGPAPEPASKSDIEALAKQIMGLHQLAAMGSGVGEIALSLDESRMLAKAMDDVSREYGVAINGKTAASIQLFATLGMIYGPRVVIVAQKKRAKKQMARTETPVEPSAPENANAPKENGKASMPLPMPFYAGDTGSGIN